MNKTKTLLSISAVITILLLSMMPAMSDNYDGWYTAGYNTGYADGLAGERDKSLHTDTIDPETRREGYIDGYADGSEDRILGMESEPTATSTPESEVEKETPFVAEDYTEVIYVNGEESPTIRINKNITFSWNETIDCEMPCEDMPLVLQVKIYNENLNRWEILPPTHANPDNPLFIEGGYDKAGEYSIQVPWYKRHSDNCFPVIFVGNFTLVEPDYTIYANGESNLAITAGEDVTFSWDWTASHTCDDPDPTIKEDGTVLFLIWWLNETSQEYEPLDESGENLGNPYLVENGFDRVGSYKMRVPPCFYEFEDGCPLGDFNGEFTIIEPTPEPTPTPVPTPYPYGPYTGPIFVAHTTILTTTQEVV